MNQAIIDPETGEISPSTATGRVTLDDVRAVLGDTDPNRIGASRIRTLLGGRGSHETIQKHLETLRAEAAARAAPAEQGAPTPPTPPMPIESMRALWLSAFTAARAEVLARTEQLATERDAALAYIQVLKEDLGDQAQALDDAQRRAERQVQEVDEVRRERDLANAIAAQRGQEKDELFRALTEQEKAAEQAEKLAEAGRAALSAEMQNLIAQIFELKAHLYQRAQAQASPPPA